jgi:transposase
MIAFPANADIVVVHTPVSFGCGIDGMKRYCQLVLKQEPIERAYFLFINKKGDQQRTLWFDGQGFSLCTKRLSTGRFRNWPKRTDKISSLVSFFEASTLLAGGNPSVSGFTSIWK